MQRECAGFGIKNGPTCSWVAVSRLAHCAWVAQVPVAIGKCDGYSRFRREALHGFWGAEVFSEHILGYGEDAWYVGVPNESDGCCKRRKRFCCGSDVQDVRGYVGLGRIVRAGDAVFRDFKVLHVRPGHRHHGH